jgi:LysR family glycine cleavage system transcriptional activator
MAHRLPSLNALRAFEAAARLGTLARAADELHVTPSAIGHQVRNLEESLGVRLFEAEGAARGLSAAGRRLATELGELFERLDRVCRALARDRRAVELHIAVTPTFAIRWLVPRLGRFHARHPEVAVHIATTTKPVDLARDAVDAALQFGKPPWRGLTPHLLFMEDVFPVCRPGLLATPKRARAASLDPHALRRHTLLHTSARRDDWANWLKAAGIGTAEIDPSRGLVFDITTMAIDAAEAGMGVAITREAQVTDALRAGRLIAPFRRDLLRGEGCYFLTLPRRRDEPPIAAFREWLLNEAAHHDQAAAG